MRILAALAVLLLLATPALANGVHPKNIFITETDCAPTPPCLLSDPGSSVERGTETTVVFINDLNTEQDVMVHLDDDGTPGSLVVNPQPVAPGGSRQVSFSVPADATGVWFMAVTDDGETARLFGAAVGDEHTTGEDSPGPGAVLVLGLLAAAVALRRKP